MEKLKVVIADDMQVIAGNNKRIATLFDNIEVVGIANNGQEEYDMIMELKPDLVITDNQMPLMNGVDVIEKINSSSITKKPERLCFHERTAPYRNHAHRPPPRVIRYRLPRRDGQ